MPVSATTAPRPVHRDPWAVVAVFVGGSLGTALRAGIALALPSTVGTWPWATFLVNATGAFLLGALLERLAGAGPDVGGRRILRLTAGTGFLGGYTTYSALTVEAMRMTPALAAVYTTSTVALGVLGAALGVWVGAASTRRGRRGSP